MHDEFIVTSWQFLARCIIVLNFLSLSLIGGAARFYEWRRSETEI